MERMEQIASLAADKLRENFIGDTEHILLSLEQRIPEIEDGIFAAIEKVLCEAAQRQQSGQKGSVSYISFSLLQSNFILGRFALRVDAWDERFLIDDNEASSEWNFESLLQGAKPNMEAVAAQVRKNMTRVQEYEIKELERAYSLNYFAVAIEVLRNLLPNCLRAMKESPALLAPEVQFTMGAYMEQQQTLYTWSAEI